MRRATPLSARGILPIVAVTAMLAACASGPATPTRAVLDRDLLTLSMSDGSTCLGPAPAGAAASGWAGTLTGCAWPYAYTVAIDPRTNPVRFILEEIFGDRFLAPVATVTVTDATGRARVFQSPEPTAD